MSDDKMRGMSGLPPIDESVRTQAREWLLHLRSGKATEADAQAFACWRGQDEAHEQAVRDLGRVWRRMREATAATEQDVRSTAGERQAKRFQPLSSRPGRRVFLGGAVTAGVAWLAVRPPLDLWPSVGELADDYRADYRTATGEQRQVEPAAGLQVAMNTQTRIDVHPMQTVELLTGEAEFVAGASAEAFTIVAGTGRLQTQTARLNVRHTGSQVEVSCLEGSVVLDHPRRRVTIGTLQQVRYDAETVHLPQPADPTVTAWRRGLLVFDDTSMTDVVAEINRYRPGRIFLRNAQLGEIRVRAQFSIDKFDKALALIHEVYGARITRWPGNIVVLT